MKRLIGLVALALILCASGTSQAAPEHPTSALGFHNAEAPLGIRCWFSGQKLAVDAGLGFGSEEIADENFSHFTLDVGLPVMLKSWDRVHFIVRPGIAYTSQQVDVLAGPGVDKDNDVTLVIQGELEAEVFLADNFSVSAAHGIEFVNLDPAVGGSATDFGTTGSDFSHLGFHVYLFGGK